MCVKYHGGCLVPWGYHDACGGYPEYRGGCSVPWGYYDKCWGFFEYRVFGTVGDIMRTVRGYLAWGDIMSVLSTVGIS